VKGGLDLLREFRLLTPRAGKKKMFLCLRQVVNRGSVLHDGASALVRGGLAVAG
jgi:hypothetical protein